MTNSYQPLRIWPAWLLLAGILVTRSLPKLVEDAPPAVWMTAGFGPVLCGLLIVLWWLLASRARWTERIAGAGCIAVVLSATILLLAPSMRGAPAFMITIPMGAAAFALGAILCSRILSFKRTVFICLLTTCGFGFSTLLRNEGMSGNYALALHWRWTPSPEDRMLVAKQAEESAAPDPQKTARNAPGLKDPSWPGFRGPHRDGIQHGPRIATDWSSHPPELLWKVSVGPAWSSFAVAGKLLYTQEQRGELETVVCYDADSGHEVWIQQVESRFQEALGGPGPRATPTLADGGLFVLGAEGGLMRLDPLTGEILWRQDLREVAGRGTPNWGFASSPLVVGATVIVFAGGAGDKGTLAFDVATGALRWSAPAGDHSYSSPQLGVVAGEEVVLMLTNTGLDLLDPETGKTRLSYEWKLNNYRALQPQIVDGDGVLIPTGMNVGTRRIRISKSADGYSAEELWTSRNLKPDFNDLVVYEGHAYGFDGGIFACIDLAKGERKWKEGRYGKGQVLLLANSEVLLVTTEKGDVVLLKPDPGAHTELTRFHALEGKTWNHPVVVEDRLYLRNAQEAACYRLPLAEPVAGGSGSASGPRDLGGASVRFIQTEQGKMGLKDSGEFAVTETGD